MFLLATLLITAAVTLALSFLFATLGTGSTPTGFNLSWLWQNAGLVALVAIGTIAFIGLSSLYRTARLSAGGGVVARQLGGTEVPPDVDDRLRQRLRNVIEEMSIASSVPVPEIYVLESEPGINAFAAGFTTGDAAIAVTRGCLERLSRDELQGVIAHEFSHILNGDMRLNIRLMGVLFGILALGLIGRTVLRSARIGGLRVGRSGKSGGHAGVLAAGAVLLIVGYVGVFFGRIIKADISRQREFLADASAVQFTRDTQGLAGALKKIGGYTPASYLAEADAEEVSHMLFALGASSLRSVFATHPPLVERIRALDKSFDPSQFETGDAAPEEIATESEAPVSSFSSTIVLPTDVRLDPVLLGDSVGNPGSQHVEYAVGLRGSIPERLYAAAHSRERSMLLIFALLLHSDGELRGRQLAVLDTQLGSARRATAELLAESLQQLGQEFRLPLIELSFPALKERPQGQIDFMMGLAERLVLMDGQIELFEYVLLRVLGNHLDEFHKPARRLPRPPALSGSATREALRDLFSILARHGHDDPHHAARAYQCGMQWLWGDKTGWPEFSIAAEWTELLDGALAYLWQLSGRSKRRVLEGLAAVIAYDGRVNVTEAELLRVVCASLDCPLPPLLSES